MLSTTALGVTLAAASDHRRHSAPASGVAEAGGGQHARHADGEPGARRHHEARSRHDSNDDEEGDDDDEGGRGSQASAQRSGPDAPVPDNGLFSGKVRPRVDVQ